ncbi:MAG: carboxypeptidase-like regulatory domain-containing protein [Muribaculaceae bacterium]|nr:carboxypeptidase-like regulatory domain-containing protein [Muribaculaceae bacterium]
MLRFVFHIACLLVALGATAQIHINGKVMDSEKVKPLAGASMMLRGADGKIKKFASSKSDGSFDMTAPDLKNCRLEVSMMSFAKQSISLDSASLPITVYLEPQQTVLKEVTVKAKKILEQGDTIVYNVGSFAQDHDRSIGDVLKRMPGINVEESGKIKYQGEDINKFYIEGSDLLGGKYGIATNGINHDDVGSVEVMENHQPMQVLTGIAFSDKAAINLKLKKKAKATWNYHGKAGGGYSWQPDGALWEGELFAMTIMSGFQNMTTIKTNNTGENPGRDLTNFFASHRSTTLDRSVSLSLPDVPDLQSRRTLFNRSAIVSTNNLWKFGRGELKAQFDYKFNRASADAANITTYFTPEAEAGTTTGNRTVVETESGRELSHSLGTMLVYELNQKTAYINNSFQGNITWNDMRMSVTGSLPNSQTASLPDYYAGNEFKIIKRFKEKHLVTFRSKIEWESMPQTLSVYSSDLPADRITQSIRDHAFYTRESAAYTFAFKGISVSMEAGIKGYLRTFSSELPELPEAIPGMTTNVVNTDYFTVFATPKAEYWIKKVDLSLELPVNFTTYHFNKSLADRSGFYFSPTLSMNWKPSNRFSMNLRGGTGRRPMDLSMIQPGFVMTNYRSFRRGTDNFYNSTSQNVSAHFSYKHTNLGLFGNAFVSQSWTHLPYTMSQQLYGDYVVSSYASARSDSRRFIANADIGKTLNFLRANINIYGFFSRSESLLLSENQDVNSIVTSWAAGGKFGGKPLRWLGFDYKFSLSSNRLTMNSSKASWLSCMKNELLINIMPHRKWEWHISGEHYRNEISEHSYKNAFLIDTTVRFKMTKRIELSAMLSNILNLRSYNYITYSQLSSFESRRQMRGRELLFTVSIRK